MTEDKDKTNVNQPGLPVSSGTLASPPALLHAININAPQNSISVDDGVNLHHVNLHDNNANTKSKIVQKFHQVIGDNDNIDELKKWGRPGSTLYQDAENKNLISALWTHPMSDDGWTLAHNSLRDECKVFGEALDATIKRHESVGVSGAQLSEWELESMKQWFKSHKAHIISHHENEDNLMTPFINQRVYLDTKKIGGPDANAELLEGVDGVDKLTSDHEVLMGTLGELEGMITNLENEENQLQSLKALQTLWEIYTETMKIHLQEEELVALPLVRAYFTPKEVAEKVQQILGNENAPKEEMGAFIYWQGEDVFRNKFMVQEGIPSFVWWVGGFKSKHAHYVDTVMPHIFALKSGEPPVFKEKSCCTIS